MYSYNAKVRRVVDGDTLDVEIDLGFRVVISQRVRLYGINTPEVVGATRTAGLASKSYVESWLEKSGTTVVLDSFKPFADDKYGRFLANVWNQDRSRCLNQELIEGGFAVPLTYS